MPGDREKSSWSALAGGEGYSARVEEWKVAAFSLIISFSTGERTAVHWYSATYKNRKRFVRIGMDLLDI